MTPSQVCLLFALAAVLVLPGVCAQAQSLEEAAQSVELPDEMLDRMMFRDARGAQGTGKRTKLLNELRPDFYAELRQLTRRLFFAKAGDKLTIMSELVDLNGRIGDWLSSEVRRAPLDALDGILAAVRARLPAIEKADPNLCGAYGWGSQSARLAVGDKLPHLVVGIDLAYYRAAAARRTRPTTYAAIDEAMAARMTEAFFAAGLTPEGIDALFDEATRTSLAPAKRCEIERRLMDALAGLPDSQRGPFVAFVFGGIDDAEE